MHIGIHLSVLSPSSLQPASATMAAFSSKGLRWASGGWSFFIAENLVLSENRTMLIDQLGDDGYHYLYGFFSTAAMVSHVNSLSLCSVDYCGAVAL